MWRNVGVMLFIFALPVMQVILFCLAIGRDPTGLRLAVVNSEMNGTDTECQFDPGCSFSNLSCRYLSHLNDSIIKEFYPDTASAIRAVEMGNAWGAIYFTENFTDALVARIALGMFEHSIRLTDLHHDKIVILLFLQDVMPMTRHWINQKLESGWTCRISKLVFY